MLSFIPSHKFIILYEQCVTSSHVTPLAPPGKNDSSYTTAHCFASCIPETDISDCITLLLTWAVINFRAIYWDAPLVDKMCFYNCSSMCLSLWSKRKINENAWEVAHLLHSMNRQNWFYYLNYWQWRLQISEQYIMDFSTCDGEAGS